MNTPSRRPTILVVDDVIENIKILANGLKQEYRIIAATSGEEALNCALAEETQPDLILLDIMMPEMNGYEVCRRLKENDRTRRIPIIFVTAMREVEDETRGLQLGAVDYIPKPISLPIVRARIKTHLQLKEYQDNLEGQVRSRTEELRSTLTQLRETHTELNRAHNLVKESYLESIYRLTLASEYKDEETGEHIKRVSLYARELAVALGMRSEFVEGIAYAAPMHDIGKVGIADSILLKPTGLTTDEWKTMKNHTVIGMKILDNSRSPYLAMAQEIAHCHHERWDGGGYPRGLKGEEIPLAARIMNIVDQYDALRSRRPYKPELSHEAALAILTKGDGRTMPDHFDPAVLAAFIKTAGRFEEIFKTCKDMKPEEPEAGIPTQETKPAPPEAPGMNPDAVPSATGMPLEK